MTHQGMIVMYHQSKHWGFIKGNNGSEWFFHLDNCESGFHPQLGTLVEYEIGPPLKLGQKDQAIKIAPLDQVAVAANEILNAAKKVEGSGVQS